MWFDQHGPRPDSETVVVPLDPGHGVSGVVWQEKIAVWELQPCLEWEIKKGGSNIAPPAIPAKPWSPSVEAAVDAQVAPVDRPGAVDREPHRFGHLVGLGQALAGKVGLYSGGFIFGLSL
jgi:hypothetical protein